MAVDRSYRIDPATGMAEITAPGGLTLKTALAPDVLERSGYRRMTEDPLATAAAPGGGLLPGQATDAPAAIPGLTATPGADADFKKQRAEAQRRSDAEQSVLERRKAGYGGEYGLHEKLGVGVSPEEIAAAQAAPKDPTKKKTALLQGDAEIVELPGGDTVAEQPVSADESRYIATRGGMIPVGQRVEQGAMAMSDEERVARGLPSEDEAADASISKKLNLQQQGDAQLAANEAAQATLGRQIRAEQNAIEIDKAKMEAAQRTIAERRAALDRDRAAVDTLQVKPDQYVQSMPAWAKILTAISFIAGGVNAGMKGGPNMGWQMFREAQEQDIQAQRDNISLRRQGVAARETALERLTQELGDPNLAEKELKLRQEALFAAMTRKFAGESKRQEIIAATNAALLAEDEKRMYQGAAIAQEFGDKVTTDIRNIPGQVIQVSGPQLPKTKEEWELADKILKGQVETRGVRAMVSGAADDTTRRNVQGSLIDRDNFVQSMGRLLGLAEQARKSGNPQAISEVRAAMDSLKTNLARMESVQTGQGAMSIPERDDAKKTMGEIEAVLSGSNITGSGIARIRENLNLWESHYQNYARTWLRRAPRDYRDAAGYLSQQPFQPPKLRLETPTGYED